MDSMMPSDKGVSLTDTRRRFLVMTSDKGVSMTDMDRRLLGNKECSRASA